MTQKNPASLANLRTTRDMAADERRDFARKGQAAQAEQRRRKRALRDVLDAILSKPADLADITEGRDLAEMVRQTADDTAVPLDQYDAIAIAQVVKARSGDTAAAAWVRDSAGDKPGETLAVQQLSAEDVELARKVAARLDASGTKSADTAAQKAKRNGKTLNRVSLNYDLTK